MSTTVELNEQAALIKPADQSGNAETNVAGDAGAATKAEKEKKSWFGGKKKATPKNTEEGVPETTTEGANNDHNQQVKEKKKKCPFVCFNKTASGGANADAHQPQFGINVVQRDDRGLQTSIDLAFEDIYGEPDSVHSFDSVWRTNQKIFLIVRLFFYKLFSLLLFIPLAIIFGVLFALLSALNVFLCVPFGRLIKIPAVWLFKLWSFTVGSLFDPLFQSISHMFANVKVARYGINNDPTSVITA